MIKKRNPHALHLPNMQRFETDDQYKLQEIAQKIAKVNNSTELRKIVDNSFRLAVANKYISVFGAWQPIYSSFGGLATNISRYLGVGY